MKVQSWKAELYRSGEIGRERERSGEIALPGRGWAVNEGREVTGMRDDYKRIVTEGRVMKGLNLE